MKNRTVRLILDCMICDAMSPEFKKANDILLRIIKTNDRTGGIEYTRLAEVNKAFKANDPKAAKAAFDKLAANIAKGEKRLQDELNEAKSKLAETSRTFEEARAALAQTKPLVALFDRFVKAIDAAKANPKVVSKLNAYADKLKAFGDFSKRIMQVQQMATAKKDIAKQCDMLKKAVEAGKAKHAKAMKKAEDDLAKAKDRVSVFKEMEKIRTKKIAEFTKEREDVQKLGQALPSETSSNKELEKALKEWDAANKEYEKLRDEEKRFINQLNADALDIGEQLRKTGSSDYEARAKKAIWSAKEGIEKLHFTVPNVAENGDKLMPREWKAKYREVEQMRGEAAEIMRRAYKLHTVGALNELRYEVAKAKAVLKDAGISPGGVFDAVDALKEPQIGKVHGVDLSKVNPNEVYVPGVNLDYFLKRHLPDALKKKNEMRQKVKEAYKVRMEIGQKVNSLGGKTPEDVRLEKMAASDPFGF